MNINLFKNALKSVGISFAAAVILLFIFNFISYGNSDPDKFLIPFAYAALVLSTFICGFIASKLENEKKFVCTIISGVLFLFIIFALSLIFGGGEDNNKTAAWLSLIMYITAGLSACLGGIAAKPRKVSAAKVRKNIKNKYLSKR